MSESKTYNGWANYETWCVSLWLENEQGDCESWKEQAEECREEAKDRTQDYWTRSECARYNLADRLKAGYEETMPDLGASVWADMLGAAFSEVVWADIADSLLADCEDEEEFDPLGEEDDAVPPVREKYEPTS